MAVIDATVSHVATFVPRGGRAERRVRVVERIRLPVAEPTPDAAPLALTAELAPHGDPFRPGEGGCQGVRMHLFRGRLVMPAELAGLYGMAPRRAGDPAAGGQSRTGTSVDLTDRSLLPGMDGLEAVAAEALEGARRVSAPDRPAALGRAAREAAGLCLVDGALLAPGPEPVWSFRADHATLTPRIDVRLGLPLPLDTLHGPLFPADRLDLAMAHAAWMAAEPRRARFGPVPMRLGSISILPGWSPAFDGHDGARAFLGDFSAVTGRDGFAGEGFPTLPVPCLAAWGAHRAALPGALAGERPAIRAAVEALEAFARELPAPAQGVGSTGRHWVEQVMPGVLRGFRACPVSEAGLADEAALSALAP